MDANEKDSQEKDKEVKTFKTNIKETSREDLKVDNNDQDQPRKQHSSEGHTTDARGVVSNTRESTLRSATTDSTRVPKKGTDEGATGGNIR